MTSAIVTTGARPAMTPSPVDTNAATRVPQVMAPA
jgi:hypothetical protein